jgi:hypothetical protein
MVREPVQLQRSADAETAPLTLPFGTQVKGRAVADNDRRPH